ncbi:C-C motif chemokine 26-like [Alosa pseudoharengus]|uniref:C-C motif chemokine 26-like n=1 Tax=Alosa pseudoharengus TaxID=34774 RepID=UPI003F8B24F8
MMTRIALLLLAACLYWSCTTGSAIALDCCLSITDKPLPRAYAHSYKLTDAGCSLKATVFTTKRGRHVCAPPPEKSEWVRILIANLNKRGAQ